MQQAVFYVALARARCMQRWQKCAARREVFSEAWRLLGFSEVVYPSSDEYPHELLLYQYTRANDLLWDEYDPIAS
jgi:hypothetical protein